MGRKTLYRSNLEMTFILTPEKGEDLQINAWNWRPTIQLIYNSGIIDKETFERMSCQGCGGKADSELAVKMAEIIDHQLALMKPGDRLLENNKISNEPKTYNIDANDIYSTTYEWLKTFRDFCRVCNGFIVY